MNVRRGRVEQEARRAEAEKRDEKRAQRTAEEQIKALDDRLGVGVGASRERARLSKLATS